MQCLSCKSVKLADFFLLGTNESQARISQTSEFGRYFSRINKASLSPKGEQIKICVTNVFL